MIPETRISTRRKSDDVHFPSLPARFLTSTALSIDRDYWPLDAQSVSYLVFGERLRAA
jgi:hypothetical protein